MLALLLALLLARVGGVLTGLLSSATMVRCPGAVPSSMTMPAPGAVQPVQPHPSSEHLRGTVSGLHRADNGAGAVFGGSLPF